MSENIKIDRMKKMNFLKLRNLKNKGTINRGSSFVAIASAINKPPRTTFLSNRHRMLASVKQIIKASP